MREMTEATPSLAAFAFTYPLRSFFSVGIIPVLYVLLTRIDITDEEVRVEHREPWRRGTVTIPLSEVAAVRQRKNWMSVGTTLVVTSRGGETATIRGLKTTDAEKLETAIDARK